jgi:hypothetical protein
MPNLDEKTRTFKKRKAYCKQKLKRSRQIELKAAIQRNPQAAADVLSQYLQETPGSPSGLY